MQTVAVRFLDEDEIFEGELINNYRIVDGEAHAEFTGDNMLSVLTMNPEDGTIFQSAVHASQVCVMRLADAAAAPTATIFDQDA